MLGDDWMKELSFTNYVVDATGKEVLWDDLDQNTKATVANDLTRKMADEIGMRVVEQKERALS